MSEFLSDCFGKMGKLHKVNGWKSLAKRDPCNCRSFKCVRPMMGFPWILCTPISIAKPHTVILQIPKKYIAKKMLLGLIMDTEIVLV